MCALQPENRLWLLLLSTVYVENVETICGLCVRSFFTTDASNRHLWATGCSALADHIWAGSLFDCMAHWQMPPGSAPWHLQAEVCRAEHSKGRKSYGSALKKGRASIRATRPILRVLAYSAINSQTASAPQLTQKQNRDNPREQGLCVLTWLLSGLFCFGDSPKWYYWFSASFGKCLAQLLNIWSPFMLGRKHDSESHPQQNRKGLKTIYNKKGTFGNETFYFISLCF